MMDMGKRPSRTVRNLGLPIAVAGTILVFIGADSDPHSSLITLAKAGYCLVFLGLGLTLVGEVGRRLRRPH